MISRKISKKNVHHRKNAVFDIASMYTNIDNKLGTEAIAHLLSNYAGDLHRSIKRGIGD